MKWWLAIVALSLVACGTRADRPDAPGNQMVDSVLPMNVMLARFRENLARPTRPGTRGRYRGPSASSNTRLCDDTCWSRNSIWSDRILRFVRIRYSALFGTYGT